MKTKLFCTILVLVVCLAGSCKKKKGEDAIPVFTAPGWQAVETTDYPYSMTAVVKLPGSLQGGYDPGDELAAFMGDQCRGTGVHVPIRNDMTFYVMIRGTASEAGSIQFKYYSANNGRIYQSRNLAEFAVDGLYGTADKPMVLDLQVQK